MIFAVHNGTFAFKGGAPALWDISFSIESGQILSILGPNGVGKTTLLRCIDFLETADSGNLEFDDIKTPLKHASKKMISAIRKKTSFVPKSQTPS